jgi:hypothetical protein
VCVKNVSLKFSKNELLDKALAKRFYQMRLKNVPKSYSMLQNRTW